MKKSNRSTPVWNQVDDKVHDQVLDQVHDQVLYQVAARD